MKAFILIRISSGQISDVVKELKKIGQVKESYMTFGPYDAVAKVEADNIKELGKLISDQIQPIPGILETLSCLAVD